MYCGPVNDPTASRALITAVFRAAGEGENVAHGIGTPQTAAAYRNNSLSIMHTDTCHWQLLSTQVPSSISQSIQDPAWPQLQQPYSTKWADHAFAVRHPQGAGHPGMPPGCSRQCSHSSAAHKRHIKPLEKPSLAEQPVYSHRYSSTSSTVRLVDQQALLTMGY